MKAFNFLRRSYEKLGRGLRSSISWLQSTAVSLKNRFIGFIQLIVQVIISAVQSVWEQILRFINFLKLTAIKIKGAAMTFLNYLRRSYSRFKRRMRLRISWLKRKAMAIQRILCMIIGFVMFIVSLYLVFAGIRMHEPWTPSIAALFVYISLKLMTHAQWRQLGPGNTRRIFFSHTNLLWAGVWTVLYLLAAPR